MSLALALMLWLAIESVAVHIRRWLPKALSPASIPLAIICILAVFGLVGYEVMINVGNVASQAGAYEQHINLLIAAFYQGMHISGEPPTIG